MEKQVKKGLEDSWGVTDRQSAEEMSFRGFKKLGTVIAIAAMMAVVAPVVTPSNRLTLIM